mmetsp:Transcript_5936/g.13497  ORF Transcript_5936/g.13497 Transcript_5936/m.13497 type:complete len:201 (+) Transcript_5936:361-963(+)
MHTSTSDTASSAKTFLRPSNIRTTSQEELMLIAVSIENKLYQTASSPRAYCALSTLEFRITALATAVLIHSDKDRDHNHHGISDTCAWLSAAARRSLVYCVMVLVSYETRTGSRMARKNEGYLQQYQGKSSSSKRMARRMVIRNVQQQNIIFVDLRNVHLLRRILIVQETIVNLRTRQAAWINLVKIRISSSLFRLPLEQ